MGSRPIAKKTFIAAGEAMSSLSCSCGSWRGGCEVVTKVVSKAGGVGPLKWSSVTLGISRFL